MAPSANVSAAPDSTKDGPGSAATTACARGWSGMARNAPGSCSTIWHRLGSNDFPDRCRRAIAARSTPPSCSKWAATEATCITRAGHLDFLARQPASAFAVPTFVHRPQRKTHVRAKPQPFGQYRTAFAMVLVVGGKGAAGGSTEKPRLSFSLFRWGQTGSNVAQKYCHGSLGIVRIGHEQGRLLHLVAHQPRIRQRGRGAADIADEG